MAFSEYNNQISLATRGNSTEIYNDVAEMGKEILKKKELNNGKLS